MKKGLLTIIKFEVVFLGLVIQVGLNDLHKGTREFWRTVRLTKRLVVSSKINKANDDRFYATIFLGRTAEGLFDTGANLSCVSSTLGAEEWGTAPEFKIK